MGRPYRFACDFHVGGGIPRHKDLAAVKQSARPEGLPVNSPAREGGAQRKYKAEVQRTGTEFRSFGAPPQIAVRPPPSRVGLLASASSRLSGIFS